MRCNKSTGYAARTGRSSMTRKVVWGVYRMSTHEEGRRSCEPMTFRVDPSVASIKARAVQKSRTMRLCKSAHRNALTLMVLIWVRTALA